MIIWCFFLGIFSLLVIQLSENRRKGIHAVKVIRGAFNNNLTSDSSGNSVRLRIPEVSNKFDIFLLSLSGPDVEIKHIRGINNYHMSGMKFRKIIERMGHGDSCMYYDLGGFYIYHRHPDDPGTVVLFRKSIPFNINHRYSRMDRR